MHNAMHGWREVVEGGSSGRSKMSWREQNEGDLMQAEGAGWLIGEAQPVAEI